MKLLSMDLIGAMASTPLPTYHPQIRLHTISAPHEYISLPIPQDGSLMAPASSKDKG